MTTLYRPVLIESAEQAEALPEGTVATHPSLWAREKIEDLWQVEGETYESKRMVGFTAHVPIEAEEEWIPDASAIAPWPEPAPDPLPGKSRFVTPWEPA